MSRNTVTTMHTKSSLARSRQINTKNNSSNTKNKLFHKSITLGPNLDATTSIYNMRIAKTRMSSRNQVKLSTRKTTSTNKQPKVSSSMEYDRSSIFNKFMKSNLHEMSINNDL